METTKKNSVIIADIKSAQLEHDTEATLLERFIPFEEQAKEWMQKAVSITVTDANQTKEMALAREARLGLRQIRISVDKTHKALKEDIIKKGRVLDKIKNTLTDLIEPIEDYLQEQEDFIKIQEQKEIERIRTERIELLIPYMGEMAKSLPVSDMNQDAFDNFLSGQKFAHDAKIEAEKKAEEKRIQDQKDFEAEQNRIRQENDKLRLLNSRVNQLTAIGFYHIGANGKNTYENERIEYSLSEKQLITMKDEDFNSIYSDLSKRWKKILEKDQKKAEEEEAKKKAERKLKRAPDKIKIQGMAGMVDELSVDFSKVSLLSEEAINIRNGARELLAKVSKYLADNAQNL